jgi:hypothetical protein
MCVPEITIRPDGKGFIVRRGGIDFTINYVDGAHPFFSAYAPLSGSTPGAYAIGDTIMEAVDSALAKVRAAEKSTQVDKP